ncbi:alpha/beta hydrolase fold domain-containing protein [bacterium AH-315-I18]|nr:alpha/beta hydrolase fold domain-containing protein [bacterium AH-315-I18]
MLNQNNIKRVALILSTVVCFSCTSLTAQPHMIPTHKDIAYGPHPKNVLDIYQADSSQPTPVLVFIHGGAFSGGDKTKNAIKLLFEQCLNNNISVVSINYQLSTDKDYHFKYSKETPVPPAFENVALAVQFIRHHATQYNIDKKKLAVSGGSAGGGLTLWLAFSDDRANPKDKDPIRHESTKPVCVIPFFAQTTYDQEYITREMNYNGYSIGWINQLFQATTEQLKSPETKQMRQNISAIDLVDATDNVSVFMCRGNEYTVAPDMAQGKFVHNVIFYRELEKKLKAFNVPYELVLNSEYKSKKRSGNVFIDSIKFMQKSFTVK